MSSTFRAAKTICDLSGWRISNLPLQKLLYLSHMLYLGNFGKPLIDGHFEAWDLGPVEPHLYQKVRAYGAGAIADIFSKESYSTNSPEYAVIADVYKHLGNFTQGQLVAITHWDDGAWAKHYQPAVKGVIIPQESIKEEYERRTKHR